MHESDPFCVSAERSGAFHREMRQAVDIPNFCFHSIKSDKGNTNIT